MVKDIERYSEENISRNLPIGKVVKEYTIERMPNVTVISFRIGYSTLGEAGMLPVFHVLTTLFTPFVLPLLFDIKHMS